MKNCTIDLIGNPHAGKTTLFNQFTGARQRVGNRTGVTAERKEGTFATASLLSQRLDRITLNRWLDLSIFLLMM